MSVRAAEAAPAVMSYYTLCKVVGVIALSLPFLLAGITILASVVGAPHVVPTPLLQRSISDYYYTPVRNVLVGSLFTIATILICTRGYERGDQVAGHVAGLAMFGVAVCPSVNPWSGAHTLGEMKLGYIHACFAAVMFLALAYFCLVLFRRSAPGRRPTLRKQHRNQLYTICGVVIMLCNVVMASQTIPPLFRLLEPLRPLLASETLALAAFGVAWLTKGKGLMRDR